MNTFAQAISTQPARTSNGMKAQVGSGKNLVDLFYNIGASRGKNIIPKFVGAIAEDRDLALRLAAWARDARGGAGERQLFRDILLHLEKTDSEACEALALKVSELGRWDDLLIFQTPSMKSFAYTVLGNALREGNQLAAKWTPRKGPVAEEIRKFFGMTPKQYRKSLVGLTNVVETKMCAKDWANINFSHVPSLAHARYKKAFNRNTTKYAEYVASLVKGGDPKVKVNAGAVFPYDVLKGHIGLYVRSWDKTELDLIQKQWEALPNFIGDASVLAIVDVSGSMSCPAGGYASNSVTSCLDVAVSLGLYFADKNKGKFKDCFLTFSSRPQLMHLKGNINQKIEQMVKSNWDMSTNLHGAFTKILETAVAGNVPQEEMPETLVIFSDMQFNACIHHDDSAIQMIERKYKEHGYKLPKVVFWNLNASYGNTPVSFDKSGVALVSGFSPALAKSILASNVEKFTPEAVMMETLMQPKYQVL